jgi:hypothetical protein
VLARDDALRVMCAAAVAATAADADQLGCFRAAADAADGARWAPQLVYAHGALPLLYPFGRGPFVLPLVAHHDRGLAMLRVRAHRLFRAHVVAPDLTTTTLSDMPSDAADAVVARLRGGLRETYVLACCAGHDALCRLLAGAACADLDARRGAELGAHCRALLAAAPPPVIPPRFRATPSRHRRAPRPRRVPAAK